MSAKSLMTWNPKQKRWFKKYLHKQYVVSCKELGTAPTKEASREAANDWWEQRLVKLSGASPKAPAVLDFSETFHRRLLDRAHLDVPLVSDPVMQAQLHRQVMKYVEELVQEPFELPATIADANPRMKVGKSIVRLPTESDMDNVRTVGAAIKVCVDRKAAQAASGERSVGRWDAFRCHLQHFADWVGSGGDIALIDASTLENYHSHLLTEIGKRRNDSKAGLSRKYAQDLFGSARQFVRWAWGRGLIELPRNIDSRDFAFGGTVAQKIKVIPVIEIKTLLAGATEATKLYLLLMLNCGMYQKDISDLQHGEVDWKRGTIARKRSKTADFENVPIVTYKLWRETFSLLKAHRSKHATLALTTSVGNPLKVESIVNGKNSKTDNIQSAYRRLLAKLKIKAKDRRPLKLLRKTSSSLLATNPAYRPYAQYFLGQSPVGTADKHYVQPDDAQFFAALAWLGRQYGIK